jgi:Cu/Ag efflux protein CusF
VNGEKVEGWMDAMTMSYKVDDGAILKKVKAGDQIMATVYDDDLVLHKVMVMPKATEDSKSKK